MQTAVKRYVVEMSGAMALYLLTLVGSIYLIQLGVHGIARYLIAVTPIGPALLLVLAVVRFFRRLDELQRRIQLESLAFGFAASAVVTFTYGFLEGVGLPHLNWTFVWPVMGASWLLGTLLAGRRYR